MASSELSREIETSNAQVVAQIAGRDVTRGQLSSAFDRVLPDREGSLASKSNWKLPICHVLLIEDDFDRQLIAEAIVFFTGSRAKFRTLYGKAQLVEAAGYYATCGA